MAYETKEWKARKGTGLDRFRLRGWKDEPAIRLVSTPDSVTQEGDTLSEANLNGLESRIAGAFANLPPIREVFGVQENREMGMERYAKLMSSPHNALKDADGNIYRLLQNAEGSRAEFCCARISGGSMVVYFLYVYTDSYVDYRDEWRPAQASPTKFYEHNITVNDTRGHYFTARGLSTTRYEITGRSFVVAMQDFKRLKANGQYGTGDGPFNVIQIAYEARKLMMFDTGGVEHDFTSVGDATCYIREFN